MRRTLAVRVMPMKMTLNLRAASSPGQRAGDVFKPVGDGVVAAFSPVSKGTT